MRKAFLPVKHIRTRLPSWFIKPVVAHPRSREVATALRQLRLNTVCQSARCPNRGKCFSRGTATFLILGDVCTRRCLFCAVAKGSPRPVDLDEPRRVAEGASRLGLRHVVITSVTRDDLSDGGSGLFADCITALRELSPTPTIEVLTPDFQGNWSALHTVMTAGPDVFNHNVETMPRLYRALRPGADYRRSLEMLQRAKQFRPSMVTKSGLMVGLGEQRHEVLSVMRDLHRAGCDMLTIGQYLSPSPQHYPVWEFVPPAVFSEYRQMARDEGFRFVASSPLTRSSYRADELLPDNFQRRAPDENHHHRKAYPNRSGLGRARSSASAHPEEIF